MRKSIAEMEAQLQDLFGRQANELAHRTGMIRRQRVVTGSSFVLGLVFGWMQHPDATLNRLAQAMGMNDAPITATGLHLRFTEQAALVMEEVFHRLVKIRVQADPVEVEVLRRFPAIIIEDSSQISLPDELLSHWKGAGNAHKTTQATLKLHVRWDLCSGELWGPCLTDGIVADQRSPLRQQVPLPLGSVYLTDNGYFGLQWLKEEQERGVYALTRPRVNTIFCDRSGQRLDLLTIGPKQVGEVLDQQVLIGSTVGLAGRLIMVRVPDEVAEQRRERIKRTAQRHSRLPNERQLALANWTTLITTVPMELLCTQEVVVIQRARWQIERLFRWWKEDGLLDEWRSKKRWRIVCEIYGKLIGLLLQQWLVQWTCWHDPHRSLVKAGQLFRDQGWRWLAVLRSQAGLQALLFSWRAVLSKTARIQTRRKAPSTAQLLLTCSDSS